MARNLDKPRGPLPVKYLVTDKDKNIASHHDTLREAQDSVSPKGSVVRMYGLDVSHAWDSKGNEYHNRYRDRPQSPYAFLK